MWVNMDTLTLQRDSRDLSSREPGATNTGWFVLEQVDYDYDYHNCLCSHSGSTCSR